jgi:WD40 repeat protein
MVATLTGDSDPVYAVALSHDGRILASGSWNGMARVWDARTGALISRVRAHVGEVRGAALSADGTRLATAGFDKIVRLWRSSDCKELATLAGHASPVYGLAMSPDGSLIASGSFDGTVRLWDAASGATSRILRNDRPYERVDITGLTGATPAQRAALLTLGAIDRDLEQPRSHATPRW